jgi:type III secretion protein L
MGLAFLITTENLQLMSERKVLKQHEYSALLDADSLVASAQAERARILEDAERVFEEKRAEGHALGFDEGRREYAQKTCGAALDAARTLDALRETMAKIVVKAVRQIIGPADPRALFEQSLRRIDALVRDEPLLVMRVPPAQREAAADALARAWPERAATQRVRIVPDDALRADQCVIETPSGSIDAGLDAQLDALMAAIRQRAL